MPEQPKAVPVAFLFFMKQRLFIASFIPEEISLKIKERLALFQHAEFVPAPLENLHITYVFLGSRDAEEIPRIKTFLPGLNEQLSGIEFCLEEIISFEQHGSKRPLVMKLKMSKEMSAYIKKMRNDLNCDEGNPFIPHITIGKTSKEYALETTKGLNEVFKNFSGNHIMPYAVLAKSINTPERSYYYIV